LCLPFTILKSETTKILELDILFVLPWIAISPRLEGGARNTSLDGHQYYVPKKLLTGGDQFACVDTIEINSDPDDPQL
jgi:hypothetical protein